MTRLTIVAEKVEPAFSDWLKNEVLPVIPGFTVLEGTGYWQSSTEKSVKVEILVAEQSERAVGTHVLRLAEQYRVAANQAEVWILREPNVGLHICKSQIVKPAIAVP